MGNLRDKEKSYLRAFDPDIGMLRGEFLNLTSGADFYADNVEALFTEGRKSLGPISNSAARRTSNRSANSPGVSTFAWIRSPCRGGNGGGCGIKSLNDWVAGAIRAATRAP